jgi:hypothetical protein
MKPFIPSALHQAKKENVKVGFGHIKDAMIH